MAQTDQVTDSEGHHAFEKSMTWKGALSLALTLPASALAVIGYWTGALGGWTAVALLAISATIAILQNFLYAEMASMFPEKAGGIALYALEAWKNVFKPLGALAAAGYWVGWSFGLAANALVVGALVQEQWFADSTFDLSVGPVNLGLAHLVAVAALVGVWLLNIYGIRPAVRMSFVVNALVLVVMAAATVTAIVSGSLQLERLSWGLGDGAGSPFIVACVWLFLMGWTVYGTEIAATFTPEYKDPRRDAPRALVVSAVLSLAVFVIMPIVAAGVVGEPEIAANPLGFNVTLFEDLFGAAGGIAVAILCLALLNLMSVSTADSGRALYGMAQDGVTVRQLGVLNAAQMPARAMTVGLVLNIGLVVLIGDLLGVIFASNLGYMVCVVLALGGYLILRRRNEAPDRLFKLSKVWIGVAAALFVVNGTFLAVAASHPTLTGYGGWKEEFIGIGVLVLALSMYLYRHAVQDRR